jgi:precorrin isomerase
MFLIRPVHAFAPGTDIRVGAPVAFVGNEDAQAEAAMQQFPAINIATKSPG